MTQAVRLVTGYARSAGLATSIAIRCAEGNTASRHVAEAAGYREVGRMPEAEPVGRGDLSVLVLYALHPHWLVMLAIVIALTVGMFSNLKFIHPVRTERWRNVSLPMALAWVFFAGWAAMVDFWPESWAHWGLVITSLYLTFAGIAQQIIPERAVNRVA